MSLPVILMLIVVFAFVVGHLLERFTSRFAILSLAEYILIGAAIGPSIGWGLLSSENLDQLQPVFSLLVGLIGFVLGARGDKTLRKPGMAYAAFGGSIIFLIIFSAALLLCFEWLLPSGFQAHDFIIDRPLFSAWGKLVSLYIPSGSLWLALGLGASAVVSATQAVISLRKNRAGQVGDFIQACSRANQITGIVVLGLILAATRATSHANKFSMTVIEWTVAACSLGIVCGLLFTLFIGRESEPSRVFLAAVGLVVFASGIGSALGISPLFVNLLAGVVVANTCNHAEAIQKQLARLQPPLFVLVLIFAGALWQPIFGKLWLLPLVYVLARWLSRAVSAKISARHFLEPPLDTPRLGSGLLIHGSLAVAIAVNLAQRFPNWAPTILSTVLFGVLTSDIIGRRSLNNLLTDSSELDSAEVLSAAPQAEPASPEPLASLSGGPSSAAQGSGNSPSGSTS